MNTGKRIRKEMIMYMGVLAVAALAWYVDRTSLSQQLHELQHSQQFDSTISKRDIALEAEIARQAVLFNALSTSEGGLRKDTALSK